MNFVCSRTSCKQNYIVHHLLWYISLTKVLRFIHVAAHSDLTHFTPESYFIVRICHICLTICLLMDIWIFLLWTIRNKASVNICVQFSVYSCYFYDRVIVLLIYPVKIACSREHSCLEISNVTLLICCSGRTASPRLLLASD